MRISYNWLKDYIDIKLPPDKLAETLTMAGLTVDSSHSGGGDTIFEIEVTANRPDWLSYVGVAREISALTGKRLKLPHAIRTNSNKKAPAQPIIKVEAKDLCPRYTARVMLDAKVGPSPAWLNAKIEAMGLRPVNNVVDITNFCLFETGEPMHAFDLDKVEGGTIVVRKARIGEKIVTIDGIERTLDPSILVIADTRRPIAVAGVMGGANTEVTHLTKNILLEAAYFDPVSVRRQSRKLGISTESSYRFERKVDINNIVYSSGRASALISDLSGARHGAFIDTGSKAAKEWRVALSFARLDAIIGAHIPPIKANRILTALGLKAKTSSKTKAQFMVPNFRNDLKDEIDLVEEVARVYGYDKIPATIPQVYDQPAIIPSEMALEKRLRETLTGSGMYEIITYSLISKKLSEISVGSGNDTAEVLNPLTSEQEMMRPGLLAGMLGAIAWNINRKTPDLKLFELGRVYGRDPAGAFTQKQHLSLGISGAIACGWNGPMRQAGFFDLKGIVEALLAGLGLEGISFVRSDNAVFSASARSSIMAGDKRIGSIGEIHKKTLADFDIKVPVYFCELCLDAILKKASSVKRFRELARYPAVFRDISIVVAKDVTHSSLVQAMRLAAGGVLKRAELIDRYIGKQIPDGKTGLTYRLEYQDPAKTLEEKTVSALHTEILRSLEEKFGAKLR